MMENIDETGRNLHPSFRAKPLSTLQLISQGSKLDDSAVRQKINHCDVFHEPMPAPVPVTYDTAYDPSHPDADWSGMVSLKNKQKKHTNDHASQKIGITHSEHGIIAKVEKQEWAHRRQPEGSTKNTSQLVISGVGGDDGADRFKTEYRRFAENEGTSRDQLILEKRQKSVKKIPDPAQARSLRDRFEQGASSYGSENTPRTQYSDQGFGTHPSHPNSPQMPYSSMASPASTNFQSQMGRTSAGPSNASMYGKKSLLSGIAGSIAAKIDAPPQSSSNNDAAFSHNRTLVTDNYRPYPGNIHTML